MRTLRACFLPAESGFQHLNKIGVLVRNQRLRICHDTVFSRKQTRLTARKLSESILFGTEIRHNSTSVCKPVKVTRATFNDLESSVSGNERPSDKHTFEDLKIGKVYQGTVEKLMPYGAFVNISPNLSADPAEKLSVGQTVQVRVIKLDPEKKQFALSMKSPRRKENNQSSRNGNRRRDWSGNYSQRDEELRKELRKFSKTANPKEFFNGKVVSVMNLGAFVDFGGPKDGLLFKSEMNGEVQVGDEVQVRITRINLARNYINLSMKPWNEKYDDSTFIVEQENLSEDKKVGDSSQ